MRDSCLFLASFSLESASHAILSPNSSTPGAFGGFAAGCKIVIGTRLKRIGMHWTISGANAIIALRCSKLSGRFEDFWERRATQLAPAS